MNTSTDKGNALENAVKFIEEAILTSTSGLEKDTFTIIGKKIVTIEGVRHEIDVWVEIDHGNSYKSLFIFECKNWEQKVGKNEVIIFSEKIDVIQAQKGFFVAKSFTKDATAQALKDKRINLLNATELPIEASRLPFDFHTLVIEKKHGNVRVKERNIENYKNRETKAITTSETTCLLHGEPIDFKQYLDEQIEIQSNNFLGSFSSARKKEGSYTFSIDHDIKFESGDLQLNGRDMEKVEITISLSLSIARPKIESHYEVKTRGRVISMAPVKLEQGGEFTVSFLGHLNN